jgi:5'-3' exonuclease
MESSTQLHALVTFVCLNISHVSDGDLLTSTQAPCEAEAQCAAMVKAGKVYATATEDMDALTFGSSVLLRHMTFSEARKMPIQEFHLNKILEELELSHNEVGPYVMLHQSQNPQIILRIQSLYIHTGLCSQCKNNVT